MAQICSEAIPPLMLQLPVDPISAQKPAQLAPISPAATRQPVTQMTPAWGLACSPPPLQQSAQTPPTCIWQTGGRRLGLSRRRRSRLGRLGRLRQRHYGRCLLLRLRGRLQLLPGHAAGVEQPCVLVRGAGRPELRAAELREQAARPAGGGGCGRGGAAVGGRCCTRHAILCYQRRPELRSAQPGLLLQQHPIEPQGQGLQSAPHGPGAARLVRGNAGGECCAMIAL